jgi:ATP-binding cassette, subfamily F, member 2
MLQIESLSLTFHGHDLIVDSELELNYGRYTHIATFISIQLRRVVLLEHVTNALSVIRRYGLLGLNGCGKSTLLTAIGCRELPIPEHMDIYHLSHEIEASDMSALQAVVSCDEERVKLEKEAEILAAQVSP